MNEKNDGLRRLRGILASPALALSYEHTTPAAERAFLRRLGLDRREAAAFLALLCAHGQLDAGAQAVLLRFGGPGAETARGLLAGTLTWPEEL